MKIFSFMGLCLGLFFISLPLRASTENTAPAVDFGEARGVDQVTSAPGKPDDSDPDDWGQGEIILGGTKPKWRAGVVPPQIAEEREREEARKREWDEKMRKLNELRQTYGDGWMMDVDEATGEPFIEGPNHVRLNADGNPYDPHAGQQSIFGENPAPAETPDTESDPDDWGVKEKIL